MRAGRMRAKVWFQVGKETPNGSGGRAIEWETFARTRGEYRPELGRETLKAGRLESAAAGVLKVRRSSVTADVTTEHRVVIFSPGHKDGVAHQIRSISDPNQKGREIEMLVERGVAT